MSLMFWKAPKPHAVSQAVKRYLTSEFRVGPELLSGLLMLEKNGRFSTRKVKMVRVYDPASVSVGNTTTLKYDDLTGTGNAKALQFEGHIEVDGALYFSDRRARTSA